MTGTDVGGLFERQTLPSGRKLFQTGAKDSRTHEWWQSLAYYANKGSEYTSKGLGKLFSDDPEYDFDRPSDYWSQKSLVTLAQDSGLGDYVGTAGVIAIGLAAEILNPLDPLNKLKILGKTATGEINTSIRATHAAGDLEKVGDAWRVKGIKEVREQLVKERESFAATGTRQSASNIRVLEDALAKKTAVSEALQAYQKQGIDIDKVVEAGDSLTRLQQVAQGERRLLGFSSPLSMDHIPFVRESATRSFSTLGLSDKSLVPYGGALERIAADIGGRGIKALGDLSKNIGLRIQRQFPNLPPMVKTKLADEVDKAVEQELYKVEPRGEEYSTAISRLAVKMEDLRKEAGITQKQMREILGESDDRLETFTGRQHATKGDIRFLESEYEKLTQGGQGPEILPIQVRSDIPTGELSDQQFVRLSGTRELSDTDIGDALTEWQLSQAPVDEIEGFGVRLSDRFVTLQDTVGGQITSAPPIQQIAGIHGLAEFGKITQSGEELLVAHRLPGGKSVLPVGALSRDGVPLSAQHIQNLEVMAAQLADRGLGLTNIDPADLLVNEAGGIQFINPSKIRPGKGSKKPRKVKNARLQSREAIRNFAFRNMVAPDPGMAFPHLGSNDAVKRATKNARGLFKVKKQAVLPEAVLGPDDDKFYRVNASQLLELAQNGGLWREFVEAGMDGVSPAEFAKLAGDDDNVRAVAQSMEGASARIAEQIQSGKRVTLPEIKVGKDPTTGQLEITEGLDSVAAAIMNRVDTVVVRPDSLVVDAIDESQLFLTKSQRVEDIFFGRQDELAKRHFGVTHLGEDVISQTYKLIDQNGNITLPTPAQLQTDVVPMAHIADWVAHTQRGRDPRLRANFMRMVTERYAGNVGIANARLSETAILSQTPDEFLTNLSAELRVNKGTFANLVDPRVQRMAESEFYERVARVSNTHTEQLAANGILSDRTLGLGYGQFYRGTIESVDHRTGAYALANPRKSTGELLEMARERLSRDVQSGEFVPYTRVELHGREGTEVTRLRDVAGNIDRQLQFAVRNSGDTLVTEAKKVELEAKGILVDPAEIPNIRGRLLGAPGDEHPAMSLFMTRGGKLFVGTRQDKVDDLIRGVYGQGTPRVQEFGVMDRHGIDINMPLEGIEKLGRQEVRVMTKRIRFLAEKLKDAGLAENTPLRVTLPFSHQITKSVGLEGLTVGKAVDPKFSVKLPKDIQNQPVDTLVTAPHYVTEIRRPNYADDSVGRIQQKFEEDKRGLLDKIAGDEADQWAEAIEEGLPYDYHATYVPRVLTDGAQKAYDKLNSAHAEILNKLPKNHQKKMAGFTKKRTLDKYTRREVNELVRIARESRLPDEITSPMSGAVKEVIRNGDAEAINSIADLLDAAGMPIEEGFFIQDPFFDVISRAQASVREQRRLAIVAGLKKSNAVTVIKRSDLDGFASTRDEIAELQGAIQEAKAEQAVRRQTLDEFDKLGADVKSASDDPAKIRQKIDEGEETLAGLRKELQEKQEGMVKAHGPLAQEIDLRSRTAWIDAKRAKQLHESGEIPTEEIIGEFGDGMVAVPLGTLVNKLNDTDELLFFPDEIKPVVEKYFSTRTRDGFAKVMDFYDNVLKAWKDVTLLPVPAFHGRNFVSNAFLANIAGVHPKALWDSGRAVNMMRKAAMGTEDYAEVLQRMDGIILSGEGGNVISLRDLYQEWVKRGGPTGSLYYGEFAKGSGKLATRSKLERYVQKHWDLEPSRKGFWVTDNAWMNMGRSAFEMQENFFRLGAFIDGFQKTGSFEQANLLMKRAFYDYHDLSLFERKVLKRLIPFYAWARKNTPAMVESLLTRPELFAKTDKMVRGIQYALTDGEPPEEKDLVPWMMESFGVALSRADDGTYRIRTLDGLIPTYDAIRVLSDPLDVLQGGFTPILKLGPEQWFNIDSFRNRALERFPGEVSERFYGKLGITKRATTEGPWGPIGVLLNEHNIESLARPVQVLERFGSDVYRAVDQIFNPETYSDDGPGLAIIGLDLVLGRSFDSNEERASRVRKAIFRDFQKKLSNLDRIEEQLVERDGPDSWGVRQIRSVRNSLLLQFDGG